MFLVALAIAPGIFWLWYFLSRDRLKPEPRHLVIRVFFLGAASGIAASLLEAAFFRVTGIGPKGGVFHLLAAAAAIGLIEETMKFLVVYLGVYRRAEFDEVIDGIIYASSASLGFATLENILYVLGGGTGVGIARAVLAVPGHAFFGALLGFSLGMAKFAGRRETAWLLSGIGVAAFGHAVYDAFALSGGILALAVVPVVVALWRGAVLASRRAQAEDRRRRGGS